MRYLKLFENFKVKGILINDIIKCIDNQGYILCDMIYDYPDHDKNDKLYPTSVDNEGIVSVMIKGINYDINIKDIKSLKDLSKKE